MKIYTQSREIGQKELLHLNKTHDHLMEESSGSGQKE